MEIDNPELIRFSNEKGRICADSFFQAYNTVKQIIDLWDNLTTLMPNSFDEIADGSQSSLGTQADGRKPITGNDYHNFKAACDQLASLVETNDNQIKTLLLKISVNGQSRF
jgi:hypothetical protein